MIWDDPENVERLAYQFTVSELYGSWLFNEVTGQRRPVHGSNLDKTQNDVVLAIRMRVIDRIIFACQQSAIEVPYLELLQSDPRHRRPENGQPEPTC